MTSGRFFFFFAVPRSPNPNRNVCCRLHTFRFHARDMDRKKNNRWNETESKQHNENDRKIKINSRNKGWECKPPFILFNVKTIALCVSCVTLYRPKSCEKNTVTEWVGQTIVVWFTWWPRERPKSSKVSCVRWLLLAQTPPRSLFFRKS